MNDGRFTGTVVSYDYKKGHGFIKPERGPDIPVSKDGAGVRD